LYCCEEMRRADEQDHFNNCVDNGYLVFGYEYDDKIKLNFCPACGSVITFTPKLFSNNIPE